MPGYDDPNDQRNGSNYWTGKKCIERGCCNPAGTAWSEYWCFDCNVKRINRINSQFDKLINSGDPGIQPATAGG